MKQIDVKTFGCFDIQFEDKSLSDAPIRRGKVWEALKYLIIQHKQPVKADELIDILWPDGDCMDPHNSLKNIIYRLRNKLFAFGGGAQFIIYSQGMYSWSSNVKITIDAEVFEEVIAEARDIDREIGERIDLYNEALSMYKGEFLCGESDDYWIITLINHYKYLFSSAVNELAGLYRQQDEYEEACTLYSKAIELEPYEEPLYTQLIRTLIHIGEYDLAKRQFRTIERLLKREYNIQPSAELLSLYIEIGTASESQSEDLSEIKTNLDKQVVQSKAVLCGPETFKRIYFHDKYIDERIQNPVILGLVTIGYVNGGDKTSHDSHSQVMKALRKIMLKTLRYCDTVCQYSTNQFLVMMTVTDERNKMAPLIRIQKLFEKEPISEGVTLHTQITAVGEHRSIIPV